MPLTDARAMAMTIPKSSTDGPRPAEEGTLHSPASKAAPACAAAAANESFDASAKAAKIMIVDDEPLNVKIVRKHLANAGYTNFITTTDSKHALETMAHEKPGVVLLDVMMPEIGGLEMLERVRADRELANTPVIIMTADGHRETMVKALKLGATDYVNKPLDPTELVARVRNVLLVKCHQDQLREYANDLEGRVGELTRSEALSRQYAAALEATNADLRHIRDEAEEANRAKSEFLANMSHEIRTPMTAILGFADVLLGSVNRHADVEAAGTIKRNGEYLLELISDILDLSKIEAGKLKVERISCSPCQVLADVASMMRGRADARGLVLDLEYIGSIPETIQSDPVRLRQVLINLVGNAVKFTHRGSVRIAASCLRDAEDPKLQFDVIDTGIGMTQEQIANLFRPFIQADLSTTRRYGGTGLGLAISKRLAEALGGAIAVTSKAKEGSTFSLTVATGPLDGVRMLRSPRKTVAAAEKHVQAASQSRVRLDCRVLLVEDGPDNQRLISFLLRKAGAEVTTVENGKVALGQALATFPGWGRRHDDPTEPFDVILMDMHMPVMDGYEATRRLRQEGYTDPIIALTAQATPQDIQRCLDVGCDAHMPKPVDRAKLLELVAQFARRESERANARKVTEGRA